MKRFVRTFIVSSIAGGLVWGIYFGREKELGYALWSAAIVGTVFGLVAAMFEMYRQNRVADSPPHLIDEVVVSDRPATHEGMVGRLYLTNRRVLFEGYPTDDNSPEISTIFDRFPTDSAHEHLVSVPIPHIVDVAPHSGGIDSRLDMHLTDGRTLRFHLEETAEWMEEISAARQNYLDEPRSESMKLFPGN